MKNLTIEAKEAIVRQALDNHGRTQAEIARLNHVGLSTLERWLKAYREGKPLPNNRQRFIPQGLSESDKRQHLAVTAELDGPVLGAYCRGNGIYSHQLTLWREELMATSTPKELNNSPDELDMLKAENKRLKKALLNKEKKLAEASALLALKKKADLIWKVGEDDS
jgi:transposase-like protein